MLFLLFQLGPDHYAVEAGRVTEVLPLVKLKSLPQAPAGVAGVFTYRGSPVPVLDLCELALGRPARSRRSTRLLVVNYTDMQGIERLLGLIAESASATLRCDRKAFKDAGFKNDGTPYLGPVTEDPRGLIQWIKVEELLPVAVQAMLFAEVEEETIG